MQQEHENIMNIITTNLAHTYHMPNTSNIIKQFSQQLAICLQEQYTIPISYLDIRRARKEKYILRVTDKSNIFHLGHSTDYEQKAQAYQEKTGAYIELESDPLWTVFDKVADLLNDLLVSQYDRMMPKRDKVALAYLYFIPKPHKVILFVSYMDLDFSLILLGRNTVTTNYIFNKCTNN
jgi:hypothetical protein